MLLSKFALSKHEQVRERIELLETFLKEYPDDSDIHKCP